MVQVPSCGAATTCSPLQDTARNSAEAIRINSQAQCRYHRWVTGMTENRRDAASGNNSATQRVTFWLVPSRLVWPAGALCTPRTCHGTAWLQWQHTKCISNEGPARDLHHYPSWYAPGTASMPATRSKEDRAAQCHSIKNKALARQSQPSSDASLKRLLTMTGQVSQLK